MIRKGLIWTAAMIGAMILIATLVRLGLGDSESVPIHWNAAGEADGFASASGAMIVYWNLIGTAVLVGGFFASLPMLSALKEDLLKVRKIYLTIWLGTIGLFVILTAVIGWVTYSSVTGIGPLSPGTTLEWMTRGILAICSVAIIVMGNHLPKTRQNTMMGIRTQKTLSDAQVWERTHRYAGKVFVIAGVVCLLITCVLPMITAALLWGAPLLVACVLAYGYSSKS